MPALHLDTHVAIWLAGDGRHLVTRDRAIRTHLSTAVW